MLLSLAPGDRPPPLLPTPHPQPAPPTSVEAPTFPGLPQSWLPKFPASCTCCSLRVPGASPTPPGRAPPALTGGPSGPRYPFAPLAPRGETSLFWKETAGVRPCVPPRPLLIPKGTQPPPCPPLSGCRPQRWRPLLCHPVSEGCTHVLSGVPGFALVPLEAGVAFRALQGTGSTWSVGCHPGAVCARLGPGPRRSWALGPPEVPQQLLFLTNFCSQPALPGPQLLPKGQRQQDAETGREQARGRPEVEGSVRPQAHPPAARGLPQTDTHGKGPAGTRVQAAAAQRGRVLTLIPGGPLLPG